MVVVALPAMPKDALGITTPRVFFLKKKLGSDLAKTVAKHQILFIYLKTKIGKT